MLQQTPNSMGDGAAPAPEPPAQGKPTRRRSIRLRLAALLFVPLFSLVALWGFSANLTLGEALNKFAISTTYDKIGIPGTVLSAQLQRERALTAVYLAAGRRSGTELAAQRGQTDAAYRAFRATALTAKVENAPDKAIKQRLQALTGRMEGLGKLRAEVDAGEIDTLEAIGSFGELTTDTIQLFGSLVIVDDLEIFQQARALISMSWAHEFVLREDALINSLLARGGKMTPADRTALAQWVATGRQSFDTGLSELTGELRLSLQRFADSADYQDLRATEDAIVTARGSRLPAEAAQWPRTTPQTVMTWSQSLNQAGVALNERAQPIGDRIIVQLVLAGGVGLVAVLVSLVVSALFGRGLARELRELRQTARGLAEDRLPGVVARLRRGEEVDVDAEAPPFTAGRTTEVSEVADAFAQVQRTAIETAVGEARLRKGVGQVFLNLAWRSQSLLHRQLRMLDEMERRTSDPEALEDLFRLDHLTTRMRRHSEGLIILSGAAPGRGWSKPVPIEDVLRAAVAEVEDYTRVEVMTTSTAKLAGSVVADVIHLLAELVENATVYSPPPTEVLVRGELVGNGFAIEVIDRGIGIDPRERAEFNARLAQPPEFDLADTDRLGLFVVARLAARHGIRVGLQESIYAGTIAVALLPHELVIETAELAQGAGPLDPSSPVAGPGTIEIPAGPRSWFEPRQIDGPPDGPSEDPPGGLFAAGPAQPRRLDQSTDRHLDQPMEHRADQPMDQMDQMDPSADQGGAWRPVAATPKPKLPRRQRQANLVPELRGAAEEDSDEDLAQDTGERSAEESRDLLTSLQAGWQRGRIDEDEEGGDGA